MTTTLDDVRTNKTERAPNIDDKTCLRFLHPDDDDAEKYTIHISFSCFRYVNACPSQFFFFLSSFVRRKWLQKFQQTMDNWRKMKKLHNVYKILLFLPFCFYVMLMMMVMISELERERETYTYTPSVVSSQHSHFGRIRKYIIRIETRW